MKNRKYLHDFNRKIISAP
uniref:Uncharacterized protein n=1 Tax=Anguilla anguilla TaxID=7936 RepID=A0A0E9W1T2_ANGAN